MPFRHEQAHSPSQITMNIEFLSLRGCVVVYHAEASGMICHSCLDALSKPKKSQTEAIPLSQRLDALSDMLYLFLVTLANALSLGLDSLSSMVCC